MAEIALLKHENRTFESQTIMVSGNAFLNCTFTHCTLIVTNSPALLKGCRFVSCNWHLDYLLMWGDLESRRMLRNLLDQMDHQGPLDFSKN